MRDMPKKGKHAVVCYLGYSCYLLLLLMQPAAARAQERTERDTLYIEPYNKMLTTRSFLSQKYTIFGLQGQPGFRDIQYRPNTRIAIGVGATYRAITLNFGYGLNLLNQEKTKGKTRYIDLQSHLYGAKWKIDLFGQFYRGYYMFPRGYAAAASNGFYLRPDLKVQELGVSAFHIYNNKRFSYRASFLQSEWQRKSAGSFLLGGSIIYGYLRADSSFVPSVLDANYSQKDVRRLKYIEMGPGAGYAYTYVWKEHWFATASVTLSIDLGVVTETFADQNRVNNGISPNFLVRAGAGYNSSNWNVNFSWFTSRTGIKGQYSDGGYNVNTGNYRFTVATRLQPGPRVQRVLRLIDRVLDW